MLQSQLAQLTPLDIKAINTPCRHIPTNSSSMPHSAPASEHILSTPCRMHAGPTLLLSSLNLRFHIIGAQRTVRFVTRQCVTCRCQCVKPQDQLLGQLPTEPVSLAAPFESMPKDSQHQRTAMPSDQHPSRHTYRHCHTCPNNSFSILQAHSHAQTSIGAPMSTAHLHAQTAPAEHSHVLNTPCRHPHMPNESSSTSMYSAANASNHIPKQQLQHQITVAPHVGTLTCLTNSSSIKAHNPCRAHPCQGRRNRSGHSGFGRTTF